MHPALAAQWSSPGRDGGSAINDLLDDFGTLLDTEWRLLLTLGNPSPSPSPSPNPHLGPGPKLHSDPEQAPCS